MACGLDVGLLGLVVSPHHTVVSSQIVDSSVLVSQTMKNTGHFEPWTINEKEVIFENLDSSSCSTHEHTREVCYHLHDRPAKKVHVAQTDIACNQELKIL